jgi:hypothetical protein
MARQNPIGNPFMLMMHPEVVLAAVEGSERLAQLERHTCRPLDRPVHGSGRPGEGDQAPQGRDADD